MQLGLCINMLAADPAGIGLEALNLAKEAGADYLEVPLAQIMFTDDKTFEKEVLPALSGSGLPVYSCNNFFPGSLRLTGASADHGKALAYAEKALDRAAQLGITYAVFGSGGARNVPDGFPVSTGFEQLIAFLKALAPLAAKRDILIVIEPLNPSESNLINTLEDGRALAQAVNHPNVALLADYYHMRLCGERADAILKAGDCLKHLHLARALGRQMPFDAQEEDYLSFFRALKQIDYRGNLSLEARVMAPYQGSLRHAFSLLRTLYQQA